MGISYQDLKQARYMDLRMIPIGSLAEHYLKQMIALIEGNEQRTRKRRLTDQERFKYAVQLIVSDLLGNYSKANHKWSYINLRAGSFSHSKVGYKTFVHIVDVLNHLEFIQVVKGGNNKSPFAVGSAWAPGLATRMRPTKRMIDHAAAEGIDTENPRSHFRKRPSLSEVRLKSSSKRLHQHKLGGRNLQFPHDEQAKHIKQQLFNINRFLVEQEYSGMRFYGLRRIFNEGDRPDFKWNLGGRLYAVDSDGNYQMLKKAERAKIIVNGEPTVELDVNASYLRILHGLRGIYLRPCDDIYDVKGLDRRVTKAWIAATLGHTGFHRRWPPRAISELEKQYVKLGPQLSYPRVQELVLEHFSVLRDWPESNIRWSRLMFEESESMLEVMERLQAEGIPSLPVHDSLIVPKSNGKRAHDTMMEVFERRFQVPFIINGL